MRQCSPHPPLAEYNTLPSLCVWYLREQQQSQRSREKRAQRSYRGQGVSQLCPSAFQDPKCAAERETVNNIGPSDQTPNGAVASADAEVKQRSLKRPSRNGRQSENGDVASSRHVKADTPCRFGVSSLDQALTAGEGGQAYRCFRELQRIDPRVLPRPETCNKLLRRTAFSPLAIAVQVF